jgi:glycosyltransferase involved in cell wall biosynthesis
VIEELRMPSVTTLHEFYTACPNGGFFDYQRNEICTRRAMGVACITTHCDVRSYPQKLWRVARQGVTLAAGKVPSGLRDVIFISELSREILTPYFSSATRWHAVRNPLQVDMTPRANAEGNAKFLFVGRLSPEKGGGLFAAAAAKAGVATRMVGDGPVRDHIAANWPGVELTGWLQPSAVLGEIRAARALVFPSFWYEGQPWCRKRLPMVCR